MTQVEPRLAADAPPICDDTSCDKPAVAHYAWDWGLTGVCCGIHMALAAQKQESLSRRVTFAPLIAAGPAPLMRDERVRLTAEAMVLREELDEAKARGLDLYRENVKITGQVQSLTVRGRERDAQLADARAEIELLKEELAKRDSEHGDLADEVDRLRTLERFVEPTQPGMGLTSSPVSGNG